MDESEPAPGGLEAQALDFHDFIEIGLRKLVEGFFPQCPLSHVSDFKRISTHRLDWTPRLAFSDWLAVDFREGNHLKSAVSEKTLVEPGYFLWPDFSLFHANPHVARQSDHHRAGDAGQNVAFETGSDKRAVCGEKDVGRACFGDMS